jgi:hypothetical protein
MLNYPLAIPATLGEIKADLTKFDAIGEFLSEYTGQAEEQQWPAQFWELLLTWPEMSWSDFAAYDAFAGALHGKLGSFLWGPPWALAPRGSGGLGPIPALGAIASGSNSLQTQGWLPNQSGVLLPGDYVQMGSTLASLPVYSVFIAAGVLTIAFLSNLTAAQLAAIQSMQIGFIKMTAASWLNGWFFSFASFSTVEDYTYVNFNLPPIGGSGGTIPGSYPMTLDTGSLLFPPARLHLYVNPNPLNTDGGGNATLDIFPSVREALPAGSPLTLINPQGTFRLSDNRRTTSADQKKTSTLKPLKCREAI